MFTKPGKNGFALIEVVISLAMLVFLSLGFHFLLRIQARLW
ncbi:MAG TPA: hypothetical protein DCW46_05435 [Desulfotomaculum sp.]|nr:hypothetical protein [Desulfotomaculum sp.]